MTMNRRNLLRLALQGGATAPLWRSVATGLPLAWVLGDRRVAHAADPSAQFLIVSLSQAGDPLNAGAPGTYGVANVYHNQNPVLAETPLALGNKNTTAAKPWSTLPDWVRARSVFFHHRTYTNSHPNFGKVLGLFGAAKNKDQRGTEILPSLYAGELAARLGTIQTEPVTIGQVGARLTYEGRVVQVSQPSSLSQVLGGANGQALERLEQLRHTSLDRMWKELGSSGTPAQKAFFETYALGRNQLKDVRDRLGMLAGADPATWTNDAMGQIKAAVALVQLRLAPVIVISIPFGGDNHGDPDLLKEATETTSGVAAIGALMTTLKSAALEDQVTFATYNVFGRTLANVRNGHGRNHNQNHHVTFMSGKALKGGVVGGLEPLGMDFAATGIDSQTGAAANKGDIPADKTLEAVAKTLGRSVGIAEDVLERRIDGGKAVRAVLG